MDLALGGINYFQTYYQNLLLISVAVSMIGWMFSLYQQLNIDSTEKQEQIYTTKSAAKSVGIIVLIVIFIYGKVNQSRLKTNIFYILF